MAGERIPGEQAPMTLEELQTAFEALKSDYEWHIHDGSTSQQFQTIIAETMSARTGKFNNLNIGNTIISVPLVATAGDIQKAIERVTEAGGGVVQLAAGTYNLDASIIMRTGVTLKGQGMDITYIDFGNSAYSITSDVNDSPDCNNFKLEGFTVQNSSTDGIYFDDAFNFEIDRVSSYSHGGRGMYLNASTFRVMSSYASGNTGNGIEFDPDAIVNPRNVMFINTTAVNNTGHGFNFTDAAGLNHDLYYPMMLIGCLGASSTNTNYGFNFTLGTGMGEGGSYGATLVGCTGRINPEQPRIKLIGHTSITYEYAGGDVEEFDFGDDAINNVAGYPLTPAADKKVMRMKNGDASSLAAGDSVLLKAAAAGNEVYKPTTTVGDNRIFGMALEVITSGSFGNILVTGKTALLKVDGTTDIAIGDWLTYLAAGIAGKASTGNMAFAMALEAYTTNDSAGVIDAVLVSPRQV